MKNKRLFELCVVLSAVLIIPSLIIFCPQFYARGTVVLFLFWLGAYLSFFGFKRKDT